jgi:sugar lactone lactonase YvrE
MPANEASEANVQILLTGLGFGESPRWHQNRLWFANWGTQQIVAVDLEGKSEVIVHVPTTTPYCFDWLRDGRALIVSGPEGLVLRMEPNGSLVTHADLKGISAAESGEPLPGFVVVVKTAKAGNAARL